MNGMIYITQYNATKLHEDYEYYQRNSQLVQHVMYPLDVNEASKCHIPALCISGSNDKALFISKYHE